MVTVRRGQSFVVGPDFDAEEEAGAFVVEGGEGETVEARELRIEIGREELFAMRPPYRAGWEEVGVVPSGIDVDLDFSARCMGGGEIPIRRAADDPNPAIVYYASRDGGEGAEPARGPFPVIAFAHGHRTVLCDDYLCDERPPDIEADAGDVGQDYKQMSSGSCPVRGTHSGWMQSGLPSSGFVPRGHTRTS